MCFQPKNTANRAKDDDHRHDLLNKVFAGATKTFPDPSKLIKKKLELDIKNDLYPTMGVDIYLSRGC